METSPLPQETKTRVTMGFPEAMQAILDGKQVTRLDWGKGYGYLNGGILSLNKKGKNFQWIVSEGDLSANDWVINLTK